MVQRVQTTTTTELREILIIFSHYQLEKSTVNKINHLILTNLPRQRDLHYCLVVRIFSLSPEVEVLISDISIRQIGYQTILNILLPGCTTLAPQ